MRKIKVPVSSKEAEDSALGHGLTPVVPLDLSTISKEDMETLEALHSFIRERVEATNISSVDLIKFLLNVVILN